MSGETLVVGSLIFRDGTPERTRLQVLEELATAIEIEVSDLRFDIYSGKWGFQNINWQSHVEAIGIQVFMNRWKGCIKRFVCSLHHLIDPEEINYSEETGNNKQQEE